MLSGAKSGIVSIWRHHRVYTATHLCTHKVTESWPQKFLKVIKKPVLDAEQTYLSPMKNRITSLCISPWSSLRGDEAISRSEGSAILPECHPCEVDMLDIPGLLPRQWDPSGSIGHLASFLGIFRSYIYNPPPPSKSLRIHKWINPLMKSEPLR